MSRLQLIIGTGLMSIATLVVVTVFNLQQTTAPTAEPFSVEGLEGLDRIHLSAPEQPDEADENLGAPVATYQSDTFKYKLRYPGTWEVDDSRSVFDGDVLSDPGQRVVITISATEDERATTRLGIEDIAQTIEESLAYDPAFALQSFDRLIWKNRHTVYTDGIRKVGTDNWRTREYAIFRPNHNGILNVSITTKADNSDVHDQEIQNILRSLIVCPSEYPLVNGA